MAPARSFSAALLARAGTGAIATRRSRQLNRVRSTEVQSKRENARSLNIGKILQPKALQEEGLDKSTEYSVHRHVPAQVKEAYRLKLINFEWAYWKNRFDT